MSTSDLNKNSHNINDLTNKNNVSNSNKVEYVKPEEKTSKSVLEKKKAYTFKLPPHPIKSDNKYVLVFPIQRPRQFALYKKHLGAFWTAEEVPLHGDMVGWENLTKNEQYFIKHILAFFAGSDGIVFENASTNFIEEVECPEGRSFYGFQCAMENIHSETYSLLVNTYITDPKEKEDAFCAIERYPSIKKKAQWAIKWMDKSRPFIEQLIAFAAVEGIFFSGSFCAIFWLKKRRKDLPGLFFSNEMISRDEGLHTEFACLLCNEMREFERLMEKNKSDIDPKVYEKYSSFQHSIDEKKAFYIISSAVEIEKEFICKSLPVDLIGMSAQLMSQYVEYVADHLLIRLGYNTLYNTKNPFEWMNLISLTRKTNFFERRVGDYSHSSANATNTENNQFGFVEDF